MAKANEKIALTTVKNPPNSQDTSVDPNQDNISAPEGPQESFIVAPVSGKIHRLCVQVGEVFHQGDIVAEIEVCKHPALFNSLCVSCGDHVSAAVDNAAASSGGPLHAKTSSSGAVKETGTNAPIPFYNKKLQLSASEAER